MNNDNSGDWKCWNKTNLICVLTTNIFLLPIQYICNICITLQTPVVTHACEQKHNLRLLPFAISSLPRGYIIKIQSQNGNQPLRDAITPPPPPPFNQSVPVEQEAHTRSEFQSKQSVPKTTHNCESLPWLASGNPYKRISSPIGRRDSVTEKFHALLANFFECNCCQVSATK